MANFNVAQPRVQTECNRCLSAVCIIPQIILAAIALVATHDSASTMVLIYFSLELCRVLHFYSYWQPSELLDKIEVIYSLIMGIWGTCLLALGVANVYQPSINGIVITFWLRVAIYSVSVSCVYITIYLTTRHLRTGDVVLVQDGNQMSWDTICRLTETATIVPLRAPGAPDIEEIILEVCTICNSVYQSGDVVYNLNCGHKMHKICMDQLFLKKSNCPSCNLVQQPPLQLV
jgi:hypothetical protein